MDAAMKPIQPHEDRKAQELMRRIERTQSSAKSATEAIERKALEDYGKKVGS
jgi:hypothetical protein